MKLTSSLKISLALNVVLLGTTLIAMLHGPGSRTPAPAPFSEQPVESSTAPARVAPVESRAAQRKPIWLDWRDWIDLVRDAAPVHVLAAMVQADFDARWQKGHDELYRRYVNG